MSDPVAVLSYAVRFRVIAKYLGQLSLVLAILTLAPLAVSFQLGESTAAGRYLLVIVSLLAVAAGLAGRSAPPAQVQANEALTVIALAFVLSPLIMTYPLMGAGLGFTDALFESISAVTTTGLSTLSAIENRPPGFLFARAWMQWYGGLGFVVVLIALLMGHGLAARRLAEPYGGDTLLTTARTHSRRMLGVYLALTLTGFLVLWIGFGDAFSALLHVLTAVSTGGFSPYDRSLASLGSWGLRYAVIALAVLGAIPLPLYLRLRRNTTLFFKDPELRALVLSILVIGTVLGLLLHFQSGANWSEAAGHGFLMGISAQTTTGYSSMDPGEAPEAANLVLIIAMFVGGGLGSTAGGIKLLRLLIILQMAQVILRRAALPPHAVAGPTRFGGRPIADEDVERAALVIVLYLAAAVLSWLAFLVDGQPPVESLFEVVSAIGTVGLSTGLTTSDLPGLLKAVLCADMLLGRLEVIAFLVLLYPRTWFGNRMNRGS